MSTSSKSNVFRSDDGDKITIGYVSSAHGVKGEFCIVPLTDFPERFHRMESLKLYLGGEFVRELRLFRVRELAGKGELILESDLSDRNEAEKLVGMSIMIDPDERVELPEDRFWVDDLIGLEVQDEKGNVLGMVVDLISTGGNEVYEIEDAQGKRHYIPAVAEFVKGIDLPSRTLTVELIEGLW